MRIAVISDIHANRFALNAFLRFLDDNPDITLVLNAGDLINVGPHPLEVVDTILDDKRFRHVIGNNEESLASLGDDPSQNRHRSWTSQHLGSERVAQLLQLPRQQVLELEGRRIQMMHARPENASELPLLYQGKTLREFSADFNAEEPDLVIFGHTHAPFYLHFEDRWFLNPGALGTGKQTQTSFAILSLSVDTIAVDFKTLEWDREALARDMIKRNVPDKEFLLERFFGMNAVAKW